MQMLTEARPSGRTTTSFVLTNLHQLELCFYYVVWILHSLGAFIIVCKLTNDLQRPMQTWLPRSNYVPKYHIDTSDPEWSFYRIALPQTLIVNFTHLGVFFVIPRLFTKTISQYILIAFWFTAQLYLTSLQCMLTFAILAILTVILSLFVHTEFVAWALCISFIMKANLYAPFSSDPRIYYREFNFYLYGAIKVLNFCIYLTRNKVTILREVDIIRYLQYLLYPPYTSLLIVVYEDFDTQMNEVEKQQQTKKGLLPSNFAWGILWKLIRLIIWFFAFEFILHFIFVHAFFNVPFPPFKQFSNYELAATAYVNGQLFFWKYVIIFGMPSWFALVDGMSPPKPPICISRVSRYSRMWRYFDRGLYQFLKVQVYIPLTGDLNSAYASWRRLGAMVGAFLFVLAWHGSESNYVFWVLLSGCELCIERIGYTIANTSIWSAISAAIGRRNQRRLIAVTMLATVIPGIFGVFFFLGRDGFGKLVFRKVLIDGMIDVLQFRINMKDGNASAGLVFVHLILLGYCFNQVCLQLDESLKKEEHTEDTEKKSK